MRLNWLVRNMAPVSKGLKQLFFPINFGINLIKLKNTNETSTNNPNCSKKLGVNIKFETANAIIAKTRSGETTCIKSSLGKMTSPYLLYRGLKIIFLCHRSD
jgi:hypothetical protein